MSPMRLQVHATDPKLLEPLLGTAHSLREDRVPTLFPGRFLVVVDSGRQTRPGWAKSVGR